MTTTYHAETRGTVNWGRLLTLLFSLGPLVALGYAIHQLWNREVTAL